MKKSRPHRQPSFHLGRARERDSAKQHVEGCGAISLSTRRRKPLSSIAAARRMAGDVCRRSSRCDWSMACQFRKRFYCASAITRHSIRKSFVVLPQQRIGCVLRRLEYSHFWVGPVPRSRAVGASMNSQRFNQISTNFNIPGRLLFVTT